MKINRCVIRTHKTIKLQCAHITVCKKVAIRYSRSTPTRYVRVTDILFSIHRQCYTIQVRYTYYITCIFATAKNSGPI